MRTLRCLVGAGWLLAVGCGGASSIGDAASGRDGPVADGPFDAPEGMRDTAGQLSDATGADTAGDECHTDADCPQIVCVRAPCGDSICVMGSDGAHHCQTRNHPDYQSCTQPSFPCCTDDSACKDAPHGHCLPNSFDYCGGAPPLPGNSCRYDECTADGDCTAMPNGFCGGGFGRSCVYGPCRTSADCARGPGGRCVLRDDAEFFCPRPVVYCEYPNDVCHADADCQTSAMSDRICIPNADLHGTRCIQRPPPPP